MTHFPGPFMTPSPPSLIALERAGVERAGSWLVRGVDLAIARGEIVTLIGPNGSGKSTTAKMARTMRVRSSTRCSWNVMTAPSLKAQSTPFRGSSCRPF